jgi:hypothetical protein
MTFSPNLGRWLQQDPIGYAGGTADLYQMEGDNPINRIDPSGLQPTPRDKEKLVENLMKGPYGEMIKEYQKRLEEDEKTVRRLIKDLSEGGFVARTAAEEALIDYKNKPSRATAERIIEATSRERPCLDLTIRLQRILLQYKREKLKELKETGLASQIQLIEQHPQEVASLRLTYRTLTPEEVASLRLTYKTLTAREVAAYRYLEFSTPDRWDARTGAFLGYYAKIFVSGEELSILLEYIKAIESRGKKESQPLARRILEDVAALEK